MTALAGLARGQQQQQLEQDRAQVGAEMVKIVKMVKMVKMVMMVKMRMMSLGEKLRTLTRGSGKTQTRAQLPNGLPRTPYSVV